MGPSRQDDEERTGPSDRQLLAQRAPILRFDDRELFFPAAVDGYVEASSLHVGDQIILPEGTVRLDDLDHRWGKAAHLRLVSDDDRRRVVKDEVRRLARVLLTPRLGRVGLFGRILDALFLLSGLFRPVTPRRTTIASALKAERLGLHDVPVVYGRVARPGEWVVLHYSFFYAMNDWRSGYRGLNDHEADWEQVWVFVDPEDLEPQWVVASSHDHRGSDLRRHWSDPELLRRDGRPILHAGAGSHAVYFRPGDYVTRLDVPALRWLFRLQAWSRRALRIRDEATERGLGPALGAPFVDAATGDGREIARWQLRDLDDQQPWVGDYRGLWGIDTGDPAGGERGPSGPKFNRNGEVRIAWADPVGFAGLHGTPPPSATRHRVSVENLKDAIAELDDSIRRRETLLPLAARTDNPDEMNEEAERLTELLRQRSELVDLRRRLVDDVPLRVDPRGHLRHPATPLPAPKESGFVLAGWAATSIPMLLVAAAAVLIFERLEFFGLALAAGAVATLAEQLVRRHYTAVFRLVVLYTLVVLFFAFVVGGALTVSRYALGFLLAAGGVVLFIANLSELRAVQHYRSQTAGQQQPTEQKPTEQKPLSERLPPS